MSVLLFIVAALLAVVSAAFARSAHNWGGDYENAVSSSYALPSFMAPELATLADIYEDNATTCRVASIVTGVLAVVFVGIGWWML